MEFIKEVKGFVTIAWYWGNNDFSCSFTFLYKFVQSKLVVMILKAFIYSNLTVSNSLTVALRSE